MTVHKIEIPRPVIEMEVDADNDAETWDSIWTVTIKVGSHTLMKRRYTEDWVRDPADRTARDEEDAVDKTLDDFGARLKELIGE